MGTNHFFEQALANFTFEAACKDSIRHLADQGWTVKQIRERLSYPASYEQVRNAVFDYFCSTGILLKEEPEYDSSEERPDYIREYDAYGKASFRRISQKRIREKIIWKESRFLSGHPEEFSRFLEQKISANGVSSSYISCDFGTWNTDHRSALAALDLRQQDYLDGVFWEPIRMYHQLNSVMKEIVVQLYRDMAYTGICYFLKTSEKITIV